MKPRTKLYHIENAIDAARVLLALAPSIDAAHDTLTKVAGEQLQPHQRKQIEAMMHLGMADAIRRHYRCSDDAALRKLAQMRCADEHVENFVRKLRYWLKGQTLSAFIGKKPAYGFNGSNAFTRKL